MYVCVCVCSCGLEVLLQVSRHATAAAGIAEARDATDTTIDLLQLFRDKKSVFCLACELLCRLVHASNYAKVRSFVHICYALLVFLIRYSYYFIHASRICSGCATDPSIGSACKVS